MNTEDFYTKDVKCPVCGNEFEVIKIKSRATRMVKRDEDFCPYYEPINVLFYSVWVCSECGYAAMEDKFENILDTEKGIIKEKISSKWTKRDFTGERTLETALETYKLALLNLQVIEAKGSDVAKVCIRIAWLYRYLEDQENEEEFLKLALDNYMEMYQREDFPVDNLDINTCMYIIGELNRRLGNNKEAAQWYFSVISSKDSNDEQEKDKRAKAQIKMVKNMARDQLQLVRENKE